MTRWLIVVLAGLVLTGSTCSSPTEVDQASGILEGKVTIGPICPVEREGQPCPVPPEAFAARKILVFNESKSRVLETVSIDALGRYHVSLARGQYVIDIN